MKLLDIRERLCSGVVEYRAGRGWAVVVKGYYGQQLEENFFDNAKSAVEDLFAAVEHYSN